MADFNVTLNYRPTGKPEPDNFAFQPDKNPIGVRPGQTIAFQLGAGPQNGKFRITFADPHFFATAKPHFHATGRVDDGDGEVRVIQAIPAGGRTTYKCELLVDGEVKALSDGAGGGEVIPD